MDPEPKIKKKGSHRQHATCTPVVMYSRERSLFGGCVCELTCGKVFAFCFFRPASQTASLQKVRPHNAVKTEVTFCTEIDHVKGAARKISMRSAELLSGGFPVENRQKKSLQTYMQDTTAECSISPSFPYRGSISFLITMYMQKPPILTK